MPNIIKTIGSGMTERAVVEFDRAEAGDVHGLIRAASETSARSSFDQLSRKLEVLSIQILEAARLPSNPERSYLVKPDGAWVAIEDKMDLDPEQVDADLPLDLAVAFCGYPSDSREGYAVRVLMILQTARQQREAGSVDEAMALAFALGELVNEAGMKDLFEADFTTGEKIRAAWHEAHKKRYGTPEEKAARREAYLQEFDRLRADGVRKMLAYELTSEKFRVNEKTIRRAVKSRSSK